MPQAKSDPLKEGGAGLGGFLLAKGGGDGGMPPSAAKKVYKELARVAKKGEGRIVLRVGYLRGSLSLRFQNKTNSDIILTMSVYKGDLLKKF